MGSFKGAFEKASIKSLKPHKKISQGDIFTVIDDPDEHAVTFPTDSLPKGHPRRKRSFHGKRYVLIIQADSFNSNNNLETVLVTPLSSTGRDTEVSATIPTEFLDDSIPGDSIAHVNLTLPILKIRLLDRVGHIPPVDPVFIKIRAIYLSLTGQL